MIQFTVLGTPVPQGSMTHLGKGRVKYRDDLKPWRTKIRAEYARAHSSKRITGAVSIRAEFVLPRPKSHYGTGANAGRIKDSYRDAAATKPGDLDKYIRAVGDALTIDTKPVQLAKPFDDDAQITEISARKRYIRENEEPGVNITIRPAYE